MQRSIRLSLKFGTAEKQNKVRAVLDRYRSCVNQYVSAIWSQGGSLDKKTFDLVLSDHLTVRQRGHALKQSLAIVSATKASQRISGKISKVPPIFRGGMTISKQLATLEPSKNKGEFDYYLRFSTLSRYNRISIPMKGTKVLRKWLGFPMAKLKPGCTITERDGLLYVIIWVELPDLPAKIEGDDVGIDIGMNKLFAVSDGKFAGENLKPILDRIRRRKRGSKGRRRAHELRRHYFGEILNGLPWDQWKLVAIEDLKNMKKGKQRNRGKSFRKIVAPWTATSVLSRIQLKAQEYRVSCVEVNPRYTSQTCPSCTHRAVSNRSNEKFKCVSCGYTNDADTVGSINILNRALGSLSSPSLATPEKE